MIGQLDATVCATCLGGHLRSVPLMIGKLWATTRILEKVGSGGTGVLCSSRARARAGCGVNRVPTATFGPVTAAAPAFARADASLQPALLLSAGGALPPWHRGPAIFLRF